MLLILLALLCTGCVMSALSRIGSKGQQPQSGSLVKPFIPDDPQPPPAPPPPRMEPPGSAASTRTEPPKPLITPSIPQQKTELAKPLITPGIPGKKAEPLPGPVPRAREPLNKPVLENRARPAKPKKEVWEDQKVKQAATRMAKKFPTVRKMKICFAVNDDEWWVILYEDMGSHYELRQFTWDRDLGKLEPFLVLKRIGKSQLNDHLRSSEPERACEVMDAGPGPPRASERKADF